MIVQGILNAIGSLVATILSHLPALPVTLLAQLTTECSNFVAWFNSASTPIKAWVPIALGVKLGITRLSFEAILIVWYAIRWLFGHLPFVGGSN